MRAGWMRHRVQLQAKSSTISDLGEPTESWATYATVWAEVQPQRAREYMAAASEQAQGFWVIKMRYRSDVNHKHRAVWDGHTLEIESVISPYGRKRDLELVCREVL